MEEYTFCRSRVHWIRVVQSSWSQPHKNERISDKYILHDNKTACFFKIWSLLFIKRVEPPFRDIEMEYYDHETSHNTDAWKEVFLKRSDRHAVLCTLFRVVHCAGPLNYTCNVQRFSILQRIHSLYYNYQYKALKVYMWFRDSRGWKWLETFVTGPHDFLCTSHHNYREQCYVFIQAHL